MRSAAPVVGLRALLVSLVCACAGPWAMAADAERQAEVSRRGAEVMPFELAKTTHVFTKTPDGGTQRVVAKDPEEAAQVALVREHLRQIRAEFERGDFSAPTRIHGDQMPGLAELKAAARGAVTVRYREVPAGAELRYRSRDPALVTALHQWFDAQLDDHGHDAMAGHPHHHGAGNKP